MSPDSAAFAEQCLQLVELCCGRVVAGELRGAFQHGSPPDWDASDRKGNDRCGAAPVEQRSRFIGGLALPIMAAGAKGHLERIKSANAYAVTSGSASFLMTMLD